MPINMHPGELLREDFLRPLGVTAYRLAKEAKLPCQRVNGILNKKRGITAETDLHLCAYFGQNPGYWLRVQMSFELRKAITGFGEEIKTSIRPFAQKSRT